jgi:hypothetical protein
MTTYIMKIKLIPQLQHNHNRTASISFDSNFLNMKLVMIDGHVSCAAKPQFMTFIFSVWQLFKKLSIYVWYHIRYIIIIEIHCNFSKIISSSLYKITLSLAGGPYSYFSREVDLPPYTSPQLLHIHGDIKHTRSPSLLWR